LGAAHNLIIAVLDLGMLDSSIVVLWGHPATPPQTVANRFEIPSLSLQVRREKQDKDPEWRGSRATWASQCKLQSKLQCSRSPLPDWHFQARS